MKKAGTSIAIIAMVIIVITIGVIQVLIINSTSSMVGNDLLQKSKTANNAFSIALENYQQDALDRAEMIAGSNDIVNAIISGDEEQLLAAMINLSSGFDLITLCGADGIVLARTHSDKKGDSVLSQQAITTALSTGKGIKTIEPGTVIGLSTRGSAAIKDADGNIIGALTCGHDLSQPKYIDVVKEQNGCDATFFANNTQMNTTLIDGKGERAVGSAADAAVVDAVINNKRTYETREELFGKTYQVCYSPVIINGQAIGMLFTGVQIDSTLQQERNMIIMSIVAIIMLLCAFVITAWLIVWTTRKSHWYGSILDAIPFPISVTDKDMKWTFVNKPVEQMLNKTRDELTGQHCSNWGAGICNTDNCGINCLRSGKDTTTFEQMGCDFRVNIAYLYDTKGREAGHIEVVQDITKTVEAQKAQAKLVGRIHDVSSTFVIATKQIEDGSQTLAQGSTQQAAAIEELSSSINLIAQKTKDNTDKAEQAAALANSIMKNAEKGSGQMEHMMKAVKDINDASHSISKVISVIDSIAFQTNILALNAAVEAARAGQHGKGFAVVAEEVRNLASKSAEAAKDTSSLIANSMEKAEFGAKIAEETYKSLEEIVSGISESSVIVNDIAASSEDQNLSISQINSGIDQVAQVVQQTSATAEESASASKEMADQSRVLEELLEQFDIEHQGGSKSLPSKRGSAPQLSDDYGKY